MTLHPTYTYTHNPFFRTVTTRVSWYQKGETNLYFTEAGEWQWHQLGHMQVCTSFQTDNHASTPPLSFLQAGCPSCHPTNSVKAVKAKALKASSVSLFICYASTRPVDEPDVLCFRLFSVRPPVHR